jgi:hypothetical protein
MSKKKKYITWAVAAGLVATMGWYFWGLGGLPLTTLTPANFDQFSRNFDRTAGEARLVVLLSPT